jgi:hypothetical protein
MRIACLALYIFGPVATAAHGGHGSPVFDLVIGFAVLIANWSGYFGKKNKPASAKWIALGVTALCLIFICSGLWELVQG